MNDGVNLEGRGVTTTAAATTMMFIAVPTTTTATTTTTSPLICAIMQMWGWAPCGAMQLWGRVPGGSVTVLQCCAVCTLLLKADYTLEHVLLCDPWGGRDAARRIGLSPHHRCTATFFLTDSKSSKSTQDCAWQSGRLRHMIQWIPATRGTWQRPRVHMRIPQGSLGKTATLYGKPIMRKS